MFVRPLPARAGAARMGEEASTRSSATERESMAVPPRDFRPATRSSEIGPLTNLLRGAVTGGERTGAPSLTRTGGLRLRKPSLYPPELWGRFLASRVAALPTRVNSA